MTRQDKEYSLEFGPVDYLIEGRRGELISVVLIYVRGKVWRVDWAVGARPSEMKEFAEALNA